MLLGMSWYQILWYLLIYSFLGWILEVVYHAVTLGKIMNRGFLNGPLCPIYGFGAVGVFMLGNVLDSGSLGGDISSINPFLIFLIGVVLATLIELLAGFLMDRLFHTRWWDYSAEPFNFHGYICLKFSLLWGLAVLVVVRVIHPYIAAGDIDILPDKVGWILLAVFYALFIADLAVTVAVVRGLNRELTELDRIQKQMLVVSDALSQRIGENTIAAAQKADEAKVQAALAKAELKDTVAELKDTAEEKRAELKDAAEEKRAELMDAAEEKRAELMDAAGEKRAELMDAALELKGTAEERAAALKTAMEQRYQKLLSRSHFGIGRLLRVFPTLRHRDYESLIEEIRRRLEL